MVNCWSRFCVPCRNFILKHREDFRNLVVNGFLVSLGANALEVIISGY